ncbi:MAG: hypothetical protein WD557_17360 [Dehalococcoidia bacterium]
MARFDPASRPARPEFAERERLYAEPSVAAGSFFRGLLVAALALSIALFVGALSGRQVSQEDSALPVLEASIDALTDTDQLVQSQHESLKTLANSSADDQTFTVPGFPLDIPLTSEEVTTMDAPALAGLLRARSARVVYEEGMSAFATTGNQDDGIFSAQGVVRRVSDRLTEDASNKATTATVVFLLISAALGVAVVLAYREDRRLRALGIGVLLGGLAGLALCLMLSLITRQAGGDDPFVNDVQDIVTEVLSVPRRNFLIVSFLGVLIVAVSIGLRFVDRRTGEDRELEGDTA